MKEKRNRCKISQRNDILDLKQGKVIRSVMLVMNRKIQTHVYEM